MKGRFLQIILFAAFCIVSSVAQQKCDYNSFLDALPGEATIFKLALQISGQQDKLPSPSSGIPITILVPSNNALLSMLWKNGFFIPILDRVGPSLTSTILYNVILGSISPSQVQQYTQASNTFGTAPTVYSLLSGGSNYSLQYYTNQDDKGQPVNYFKPQLNDGLAGAWTVIPVCGSYIYVTDEVLIPSTSGKLSEVQTVNIPDNLPWSNTGSSSSATTTQPTVAATPPLDAVSLAPAPSVVSYPPSCVIPTIPGQNTTIPLPTIAPTPPPPPPAQCNTTFVQAAKDNGLSILSAALEQPAIASQLPDPSQVNTLLAPIDSAFFTMLSTLNISITDALGLGNRLAGVILYHVHPNEALTPDQIRQKTSLSTALGARLNEQDQLVIGVNATGPDTIFTSLKPGNTAKVIKELKICSTSVFVIDSVLLPADSVANLPDPGPMQSTNTMPTNGGGNGGGSASSPSGPSSPLPSNGNGNATTDTGSSPVVTGPLLPSINPNPKPSPTTITNPIQQSPSPGPSPPLASTGTESPPAEEERPPSPPSLVSPSGEQSPSPPSEDTAPAMEPSPSDEVTPLSRSGILDNGVAAGVGPFANCVVQLFALGNSYNTTTDGQGKFSFPNVPECAIPGSRISLPSGLDQFASCIDTATGLPPPYSLSTMLQAIFGNLTSILSDPNSPGSNALPINLSPLTTLISSPNLGASGSNPSAANNSADRSGVLQQVASLLGFSSQQSAVLGNFVQGVASGSPDGLASLITNAQSMITGLIGGSALSELFPGIGLDKGVSVINDVLAENPSSLLNLTDRSTLAGILQQAYDRLKSSGLNNVDDYVAGYAQPLSRKLLQATVSSAAAPGLSSDNIQLPSDVFAAISDPMSQLNSLARDGFTPGSSTQGYAPQDVNNLISRVTLVAQNRVAPAAADLASGHINVSDFSQSYSSQKVMSAVRDQQLPSVLQAPPGSNNAAAPSSNAGSVVMTSIPIVFSLIGMVSAL